jgi:hypothetical protein
VGAHPLQLLQRVGFHTVRLTVSEFRNGRDFVFTVKTSVRARLQLQPCRKSAEKKSSLRRKLARNVAKR